MTHPPLEQAPSQSPSSVLNDHQFLTSLRAQLLRFATLQLSDCHLAEDAVQESLVGALKNAKSFSGRSALKTWVFAILKNKIADTLRQKQRLVYVGSLAHEDDESDELPELFDARGHWTNDERPAPWMNPQEALQQGQFWQVFEVCLDNLPGQLGRIFMMKEFVEMDASEICAEANITVSNLHVTLHRARLRLRECLENRWFSQGVGSC